MSKRFGKRRAPELLFLVKETDLPITQVTNRSFWSAAVWRFDVDRAGKGNLCLNWQLDCPEARWKCPSFQILLDQAKRILLSSKIKSRRGKNLKSATLQLVGAGLRLLINWMHSSGLFTFSALTPDAFARYARYLAATRVDVDEQQRIASGTLAKLLDVAVRAFEQSVLFEDFPDARIPQHPLRGETAHAYALGVCDPTRGSIPPVPDAVFDPLMTAALDWIENRSADILELVKIYTNASRKTLESTSHNYLPFINQRLLDFRFNGSGSIPDWRPPLCTALEVIVITEEGEELKKLTPAQQFRDLIMDLYGAATCIIQGFTGIRVSELAGLKGTPEQPDGSPACIKKLPAMMGHNEAFYLVGYIYKSKKTPEPAEWIIAVRPFGVMTVPPVVKAIEVILKLFDYWRQLAGVDELSLSVVQANGLARLSNSVGPIMSDRIRTLQQKFLARHVQLGEDFANWVLTTHQFRKKFAHDIIRSDSSAVPEVRLHFHHLSDHIVLGAYYGNDPSLVELVNDTAVQQASLDVVEIIFGRRPSGGRAAGLFEKYAPLIRERCGDGRDDNERIQKVARLLIDEKIKVWPSRYGSCYFRSETARCHFLALGNFDRSSSRPHPKERTQEVCFSCSNLLVLKRHEPFWKRDYEENTMHYENALEQNEPATAYFLSERLDLAAAILTSLGAKMDGRMGDNK